MPAGIVYLTPPTTVMPISLSRAFTETQTWPARVNEYHDGASQRSLLLPQVRRSWQLTKRLTGVAANTLRTFWQMTGTAAFYFYNPKETSPLFSYDASGAATAGRRLVRFTTDWTQSAGLGRLDIPVGLIECIDGSPVLSANLGIVISQAWFQTNLDLANQCTAAEALVNLVAPLHGPGGVAVWGAAGGPSVVIGLSQNCAAINAAIATVSTMERWRALWLTVQAAVAAGMKSIVVMADGPDDYSGTILLSTLIAECVAAGATVYILGFYNSNGLWTYNPGPDATNFASLAAGTGGVYYPVATSGALAGVMPGIAAALLS